MGLSLEQWRAKERVMRTRLKLEERWAVLLAADDVCRQRAEALGVLPTALSALLNDQVALARSECLCRVDTTWRRLKAIWEAAIQAAQKGDAR
jgi:hypothetical protein